LYVVALNRGILLTPFHNMALFTPLHTVADVDRHTSVFASALERIVTEQ
jgi:glutamate-1-semialdehyde 2,1-aminomutase